MLHWRSFPYRLSVLCLVVLGVGALLPGPRPAGPAPGAPRPGPAVVMATAGWRGAADGRALPADLAALPEVVEERTANSATFREADGSLTSLFSLAPLHYQDAAGRWQPVDARIERQAEGFVVTRNSLASRAGLERAWLATGSGELALNWQAEELGVRDGAGVYRQLASARPEGSDEGRLAPDRRSVAYAGGWSDPAVSEAIVSAPGSVEQLLLLAEKPAASGSPRFLELRAHLSLVPGATLWAEGEAQQGAFTTAGALEIRKAPGDTALLLAPVVAFEQAARAEAVAGEYVLRPGESETEWEVTVRTPWSWWADPARTYPVALDPTMRVLRGSGGPEGMGWVSSGDDWHGGEIRLGAQLPTYDALTRGYIQFRDMPALINDGTYAVDVTSASLEVQATLPPEAMPVYANSPEYWDQKVIKRKLNLYYVGACPGGGGPNGESCPGDFAFDGGPPLNYSYGNSPPVLLPPPLATETIGAGPAKSGGQGDPVSFDVTNEIRHWYQNYFVDPQSNLAPMFMLQFDELCPKAPPYFFGFTTDASDPTAVPTAGSYLSNSWKLVPRCLWFYFAPGDIRLRIEHQRRTIAAGATLVNAPGIPSYLEGTFQREDGADTRHYYDLVWSLYPSRWRALAVRANHKIGANPALDAALSLELHPWADVEGQALVGAAAFKGDTAWFAFDGHSPADDSGSFTALVGGSNENNFALDRQRNYVIEHAEGDPVTIPVGGIHPVSVGLDSGKLLVVREFYVDQNAQLTAVFTPTGPFSATLLVPAAGTGAYDAAQVEREPFTDPGGSGGFLVQQVAPRAGTYAIAVVNNGPPVVCEPDIMPCEPGVDPGDPGVFYPELAISICPEGTYYAARFKDCQDIWLPSAPGMVSQSFNPAGGPALTIWNRGGFVPRGSNGWCTTNEGLGAPIIGPGVGDRYVAVIQGSVCATPDTLWTTEASAVALVAPVPSGAPKGQVAPTRVFGNSAIWPATPQSDGKVLAQPDGRLVPTDNDGAPTVRAIQPFSSKWAGTYHPVDYVINLNEMRLEAEGTVGTLLSVDLDLPPEPMQWQAGWWVRPETAANAGCNPDDCKQYAFGFQSLQQPVWSGGFPFSGMTLRILNGGGTFPGAAETVDARKSGMGPQVQHFRAWTARITQDARLGGATRPVQVVIDGPGQPLAGDIEMKCVYSESGEIASCLDLRWDGYQFLDGKGDVAPLYRDWNLPDIQIVDQAATVAFAAPGGVAVFSNEHPDAPAGFTQSFSFDTWEATAQVSRGICLEGGNVQTITRGTGKIALPMLGDHGGLSGPAITVSFQLCETRLEETYLSFKADPSKLPIGSTGLGATRIAGTVVIGPDSTRITIELDFESLDGGTFTEGVSTVTIDTAGLFQATGSGELVGILDTSFSLDVAWNPLDMLLEGDVTYGSFISGYLRFHGWVGQGWQGKYPWIQDDDFHFTGTIGGKVRIPKGELIDEGPFQMPPASIGFGAQLDFGEFCANSGCTPPYPWGIAATVNVFGYKAGVYVDQGGSDIILGTKGKVLIDQHGGGSAPVAAAPVPAAPAFGSPQVQVAGAVQPYLFPPLASSLDGLAKTDAGSVCQQSGPGGAVHTCPFTVGAGTGRALIAASWLNDNPTVTLITPGSVRIGSTDLGQGVTVSTTGSGPTQKTFTLAPASGSTLAPGVWHLELDGVTADTDYMLLYTADPPAPEVSWLTPVTTATINNNSNLLLTWDASRAGAPLEANVTGELLYTSLLEPQVSEPYTLTFTGDWAEALGVAGLPATDDNGDGVWRAQTAGIPAGSWVLSASVTSPLVGGFGGVPFTVGGGETATFYYDSRDNTVAARPGSEIVVLTADVLAKVGGGLWDPANLVGWLKETNTPGQYRLDIELPPGDWEYKVALNESWAENYGAGGVADGPNIPLHVPDPGATMRFTYDAATHVISHTLLAPRPGILAAYAGNLNNGPGGPTRGSISWNGAGLAAGAYRVGLRVNDTQQGNGISTHWAPGVVVVGDTQPPPVPVLLTPNGNPADTLVAPDGAIRAVWERVSAPDLAGYEVEYSVHDWNLSSTFSATLRLLPSTGANDPLHEQARLLGTLLTAGTTVCVRAFDASGNLSACAPASAPPARPGTGVDGIGPPQEVSISYESGDVFGITWMEPLTGTATGYYVGYEPAGCRLGPPSQALEGPSPLNHDDPGFLMESLSELTVGQAYRIWLRAYNAQGAVSREVSEVVRLIDPTDANANGMPDAWEDAYGIVAPGLDPDQDGLTNFREAYLWTHPLHADSDGDGYYDGEEALTWGTDPCGPEQPPHHTGSVLALFGRTAALTFQVPTNSNVPPAPETFTVHNRGGGTLGWDDWTVHATAPWVTVTAAGDDGVNVGVDVLGYPPGHYTGTVIFNNPVGDTGANITETVVIPVAVDVLPAKQYPRAVAVQVAAARAGSVLSLAWAHEEADLLYEVYRGSTPYFNPAGLPLRTLYAPDSAAVDEWLPAAYYVVRATGGNGDTVDGNRVGQFRFELVAGGP